MSGTALLAGGIFLAVYALIVTDTIHRALEALLVASVVIILRLADQHEPFAYVDFTVIFLLAGMMIIANIMARTGVQHPVHHHGPAGSGARYPITFVHDLRYGVPATLVTMIVARIDIWIRYLVLS